MPTGGPVIDRTIKWTKREDNEICCDVDRIVFRYLLVRREAWPPISHSTQTKGRRIVLSKEMSP
jgi:hypothetical protein